MYYNTAKFLLSVASPNQLPNDLKREVAFVGRSNSGKSSSVNTITNIKGLAKTSKTPGRTQLINFFELEDGNKLVDLPGYGYAKVQKSIKKHWEELLEGYLSQRQNLAGVMITMDIRHPFKESDEHMINWCLSYNIPVHLLLTKADKLTKNQANKVLFNVKNEIKGHEDYISAQLFSSLSKLGVDEARKQLDNWLITTP